MQFTSIAQEHSVVTRRGVVVVLVALAFLSFPLAADAYQPIRAVVGAVALGLALVAVPRKEPGAARWALLLLGALLVLYIVAGIAHEPASSIWGVHGRFQALLSLGLAALAGFVGWYALASEMRWLARVMAVAAGLQGLLVIANVALGSDPVGTIGNRVLLGSWLALTTTGALASWRLERGASRWLAFVAAALGAAGLGLAGSRGAWVGLAAGVLVIVLAGGIKKTWPVLAVGAVIIAFALGVGGESAAKLSPGTLSGGSASSRLEIWKGSAALIADNPLLGVGPGRFLYEYPAYQTPGHARAELTDTRPDEAHSYVLQAASDAGVVAPILLVSLAAIALWGGIKGVRARDPGLLVALAVFAAFLGQALFGIGTVETDVLGWVVGGVLVGAAATRSAGVSTHRWRWLAFGAACIVALGAAYYLYADVSQQRGTDAFEEGRFADALAAHDAALSGNPLVDTYRVGYADAALFARGETLDDAADRLDRGLELEPKSYDLALARARVLVAQDGAEDSILAAYDLAVELYPLGVEARLEAADAYLAAGNPASARELAEDVLLIEPDNPSALMILEATPGG